MKKHFFKKLTVKTYWVLSLVALGLILIILGSGLIIQSNRQRSYVARTVGTIFNQKDATKSGVALVASASAHPKIQLIPQNYGRTVHIPILTYHYIRENPNPKDKLGTNLSVPPDRFDLEMGYLKSQGYNPIDFDQLYEALYHKAALPSKAIILTFDDGYVDFFTNAYPILQKYGFKAVSFIPTGLMDQSYYLHWDQIRQMNSSGLISFQAHSVNHPNLTSLTPDQITFQIFQSKKVLEANLGKPVNTFAYPYGSSNQLVWDTVKKAGYKGAVGTWFGTYESEGTVFDMPRVKISGESQLNTFEKLVSY